MSGYGLGIRVYGLGAMSYGVWLMGYRYGYSYSLGICLRGYGYSLGVTAMAMARGMARG